MGLGNHCNVLFSVGLPTNFTLVYNAWLKKPGSGRSCPDISFLLYVGDSTVCLPPSLPSSFPSFLPSILPFFTAQSWDQFNVRIKINMWQCKKKTKQSQKTFQIHWMQIFRLQSSIIEWHQQCKKLCRSKILKCQKSLSLGDLDLLYINLYFHTFQNRFKLKQKTHVA